MRKYSKRLLFATSTVLLLVISSFVSTIYVGSNGKGALSERKADHYNMFSIRPQDILFIGDDITAEAPLHDMFPDVPVRNRGIIGDLSSDILLRSSVLAKNKPAIIFINFGANDLRLRVPLKQIIANYRETISLFSSLSPNSQIVISATLPLGKFNKTATDSLNKALKKIAEKRKLDFIDLPKLLQTESGQFKAGMTDKSMHLLGPAYVLWQQEINAQILQTRPLRSAEK